MLIAIAAFSAACRGGGNEPEWPVYDSEVMVSVRMSGGAKPKAASLPDPGADHGENDPAWHTIGIYLAYTDGRVLSHRLTREAYQQDPTMSFNAYEGTATVYAVAFGGGQQFALVDNMDDLKALATLPMSSVTESGRRAYMQSLFSGKSTPADIVAKEDGAQTPTRIDVTLYRLMAKVDVQYDVQDAYENGGYTQAAMSDVTCRGSNKGYFFPEEAKALNLLDENAEDYTQTFSGSAVSQRNGRAYFYTFPGVKNKLDFTVEYVYGDAAAEDKNNGPIAYQAVFQQPLGQNSWHYVQLNVLGKKVTATPAEIELTE